MTAGILLCAGAVFCAGCGAGNGIGQPGEAEQAEMPESDAGIQQQEMQGNTAGETADASAEDTENALDGGQDGKADAEESGDAVSSERAQELLKAQIRHYYGGVLSQITAAWQLPDGELDTSVLNEGFGEMQDNHFAVTDIDGDGREELIVCNGNASMLGMVEIIYDYDPVTGELRREFESFPALTYFDNGIIKAEASHNHSRGEFLPFALFQYQEDGDVYGQIGYVDTWDKSFSEEWDEGQPFPDELDADGDGTLYQLCDGGEPTYDYADYKYNKADYEAWYGELMDGAEEISLPWRPMAHESYADFTPAYLKMLAEEADKGRTDTAADLGLLILNEDRFLDAAQNLLSEKYGVTLEQPDPDFEEWTVGKKEGKELFSFEALNAGSIGYRGEKLEDVTIFGIYPGISVDGAWEKLRAYGFYASSYPEVENCLVTGEGFGNISIWFSAEDNVVTDITVRPYCAFAG